MPAGQRGRPTADVRRQLRCWPATESPRSTRGEDSALRRRSARCLRRVPFGLGTTLPDPSAAPLWSRRAWFDRPNFDASIWTNSSRDSVGFVRCTLWICSGCFWSTVRISVVFPEPASPVSECHPLPARDGVLQVAEHFAMRLGQHEEPRVRVQIERPFAKTEELFVHVMLSEGTCTRAPRRRPARCC